MNDIGSRTEDA